MQPAVDPHYGFAFGGERSRLFVGQAFRVREPPEISLYWASFF